MIKLLVLLLVVFTIVALVQLVRITELVAELKGKNNPETVSKKETNWNAILMMLFLIGELGFIAYQLSTYGKLTLPVSASAHGVETDSLLNVNFLVIGSVFLVTQILLFWYAFKYKKSETRRATFYPDNHKIELIWTVTPTIVLIILIVFGLKTWNKIVTPAPAGTMQVELYAKQFDWTARYAGMDQVLGNSFYKNIGDRNDLGLDTTDVKGHDDIIVKELHLPVNTTIDFSFHSRDVIHSAYFPHFRSQMNCVPGMTTKFVFTPTITTEEMRKITKNDKFEYVLLCNKVCGVAHYNMKMKIVVETKEQYEAWLAKQATFIQNFRPVAEAPAAPASADSTKKAEKLASL